MVDFCAETDLIDITRFLDDPSPQTKMSALGIIHGLTGSPEGIECMKGLLGQVVPTLLRLTADPSARVSHQALECLVNLSAEPATKPVFLSSDAVGRLSKWQRGGGDGSAELVDVLMSNLKINS